jgi:hypothetical protein
MNIHLADRLPVTRRARIIPKTGNFAVNRCLHFDLMTYRLIY